MTLTMQAGSRHDLVLSEEHLGGYSRPFHAMLHVIQVSGEDVGIEILVKPSEDLVYTPDNPSMHRRLIQSGRQYKNE